MRWHSVGKAIGCTALACLLAGLLVAGPTLRVQVQGHLQGLLAYMPPSDFALRKPLLPCAESAELAKADMARLKKRKICIEHPTKLLTELVRYSKAQRPDQTVRHPAAATQFRHAA